MSSFDEFDAFEGASLAARAMATRPTPYLDELNPAQREAVEKLDGPVLMLAGAGTGKTKALTSRIVHLLNTGQARPNEILAVTFTNKAAREMKNRVGRMLGQSIEGMPWLGTFHSVCVKLLRRHAELVGLKSNFTIIDTDDQKRLIKQLAVAHKLEIRNSTDRWLASIIDSYKNNAWTPEQVPASHERWIDLATGTEYRGEGIPKRDSVMSSKQFYMLYEPRLKNLNACDFGGLLLHVVEILRSNADVLDQYRRWFRYILVDEYQDTNIAQYLWLKLLAKEHKNICCVGDDDQSIYGWRGAEVGNILKFEKDFPGAHVVRLEQNYRSTPHILAAASAVISGNKNRLGKTLWTEAEEGEKVRLIGHWDGEVEARWIGEEVEALQSGTRGMTPYGLEDMAILVRASHQMRAFEDRFLTIGLPYRVIGGPRFYERMEIRDAMAYFRVVTSPEDDLAFERIVNTPKRGLGNVAVQKIQASARENGVSLVEGARLLLDSKGIGGKGAKELRILVDSIDRWRGLGVQREVEIPLNDDEVIDDGSTQSAMRYAPAGDNMPHTELAEIILDESGYTSMWQNDKTPEAPGRLENLKELVGQLANFDNLQGFLEHVSLVMDNDNDDADAKISIMTLHAAKGLEFPVVFLPGWEDGLFPSQRSMDESGLKGLEEERRLAYVGITRAEEICTISFAGNRRIFGQWQSQLPSRFIDELSEEDVEVLTAPGIYGGGHSGAAGDFGSGIQDRVQSANTYNSPGWKRLQERSSQRGLSQPKESKHTIIDLEAVSSHSVGDRVFHQKFGYGEIMDIEGDKLVIEFDKAGEKKVVAKFVTASTDIPF